jgi:hypothetical protein
VITNSTNVHGPAVFQFILHPQNPVSCDFTIDTIIANTVYNKIFFDSHDRWFWYVWTIWHGCQPKDFTQFCHWKNFKTRHTIHIIKQIRDKPIYSTLWHMHNTPQEHIWKVTDQPNNHKHCQKTHIVLYTTLPPTNARYVWTPHYSTLLKFITPIYTNSKNKPGKRHCKCLWSHLHIHFCTKMNTTKKFKLTSHH